jgi:threonine dehydrogenase-like Zn-dependent dehydrogenase
MSRATQAGRLRADPMRPVLDGRDVCLDPPATAQVWLGPGAGGGSGVGVGTGGRGGAGFSEIAVPGVRLARGDALVAVELAVAGADEVDVVSGRAGVPAPVVLGGSAVGRVVEADEHARAHDGRRLRPGMRVVWSRTVTCGRCAACHRGLGAACTSLEGYGRERTRRSWQLSGAFASHVHLRRGTAVLVVSDDVPAAVLAPVAGATATAAEMLDRASSVLGLSGLPSVAGQVVVVSGAGTLGLVATAMATDSGARVVVVDPQEARRERSRAFGAVAVVDPAATAGPHALSRVLAAVDRSGRHRTVGLAVDGAGASTLVEQVAVGGVVVLARGTVRGDDVVVAGARLVEGLVTVTGAGDAGPERLASAVAWASEAWRRWPLGSLVDETVRLTDVGAALTAAGPGDGLIGVEPEPAVR